MSLASALEDNQKKMQLDIFGHKTPWYQCWHHQEHHCICYITIIQITCSVRDQKINSEVESLQEKKKRVTKRSCDISTQLSQPQECNGSIKAAAHNMCCQCWNICTDTKCHVTPLNNHLDLWITMVPSTVLQASHDTDDSTSHTTALTNISA